MAAAATARRIARYVYLAFISLFLVGILVQAYTAGRYIWGLDAEIGLHEIGWPMAHMFAPIVFLISLFLKGGRAFWITSIVWIVSAFVQPMLAVLDEDGATALEALHPVNALVLFALTLWLQWRAWNLANEVPNQARVTPAPRPAAAPVGKPTSPPMRR